MNLEDVIQEKDLLEAFNISKGTLAKLRQRGLPFFSLNRFNRIYLVPDILEWMRKHGTGVKSGI